MPPDCTSLAIDEALEVSASFAEARQGGRWQGGQHTVAKRIFESLVLELHGSQTA